MISANHADNKQHASAPTGTRCADCMMDGEACPRCYQTWWQKRHPHTNLISADDSEVAGLRQDLQRTKEQLARVEAASTIPSQGSTAKITDGDKSPMPRTRRINPICWVHDDPREGCPDCEAEQAYERTPNENSAVDPIAASAPQASLRATDSSSSDLDLEGVLAGLRALIAQWRGKALGIPCWDCADELEALLAPGRPAQSPEET